MRRSGFGGRLRACLLLFLGALLLALPRAAQAEGGDRVERLRMLFTTQQPKRLAPKPKTTEPAKRRQRGAGGSARPAQAMAATLPRKAPDARVLLVLGDALGASLAQGLTESFGSEPGVRVVWRPGPSAGLAHGEAEVWPKALADAADREKPTAVLVMLGANDRRRMRLESGRAALLDGPWRAEYALRATALAEAARARGVPLLWIGLPPVRDRETSRDFLAFNEIVRAALPPGAFVDAWDGFADEAGAFAMRGPGVDGITVRLRRGDGVGFTAAGARKLAFFAARPLGPLLGLPAPDGAEAPAVPLRRETLPEDAAFGTGELLRGADGPVPAPATLTVPLDPAVPEGRADDFGAGRQGR